MIHRLVRRVQNLRLWLQFWASRERVQARPLNANNQDVEIQWLFHGCRTTAARGGFSATGGCRAGAEARAGDHGYAGHPDARAPVASRRGTAR